MPESLPVAFGFDVAESGNVNVAGNDCHAALCFFREFQQTMNDHQSLSLMSSAEPLIFEVVFKILLPGNPA